ncbi:uncharacterized protein LOC132199655 [Neocloeon triangulifer]|uniref:uncharacterized protein LOC132199655 n=1 Tax=Neocloeon triangulifer TaxID=2078957 RepID=UPI00286F1825|nr:uncharacterized protein LOC132199655 [Neocloeon triangulifer]
MRRLNFLFVIAFVSLNVAQGQNLLFQDEVEILAKELNQLAVSATNERGARQDGRQRGYAYQVPVNPLPQPSNVAVARRPDPEHHHHDDHHGAHSHTHLTRLDVTCDNGGMRVELEFDGPYNGIVYSKGHFKDRKCRYVNKDSARGDFNFLVPMNSCGTIGEDRRDDHETILIFQNEESVQEVWDVAKRVRCPTVERKKIIKTVSFNPFTVARLEIEDQPIQKATETNIECWMDIQVGDNPCGSPVKDRVKIGDQLSAVIYVKDGGAQYDILVKDCYAHDTENLNARNASSVQLSDGRGCPRKEKLMGIFRKSQQTCSSGADIVAFAPISAFKFADRPDVFLTCIVELCPGGCDQCESPSSVINTIREAPFKCTPNLVGIDSRCPAPTTPRPTPFVCTPDKIGRDRRCPAPTTPFVCTPALVGRDVRCPAPITTTQRTTTPFVCTPERIGRDRRCPAPRTTTQFSCTPELIGVDYRCPAPTTIRTTTQFICTPDKVGRDRRCPAPRTTTQFSCTPDLIGVDYRCPAPTTVRTTTQFVCTPALVGRDPRCPAPTTTTQRTTTPFVCTPDKIGRDRRCPAPRTTTQFSCTPDLIGVDYRCPAPTTVRTTTQFVCTPALVGRDPRCPAPSTTTQFVCTQALRGKDPRCPAPTTTPAPTTRFVCTPQLEGNDPRCPATGASFDRNPSRKGICEFNPTAPGCGISTEGLQHHAFHKWQAVTGRGTRRKYDGSRPTFSPQTPAPARRRRDVSQNIVITGVSTGFHLTEK